MDLVVGQGVPPGQVGLVEIKSGQTVHGDFLRPIHRVAALLGDAQVVRRMLVYGGDEVYRREEIEVVGLQGCG